MSGLYSLGMCWLPHAEDRSVERVLRCAAEAVTHMGVQIAAETELARSPDTSFGSACARRLSALTNGPIAGLSAELVARADELRELQRQDDERERRARGLSSPASMRQPPSHGHHEHCRQTPNTVAARKKGTRSPQD